MLQFPCARMDTLGLSPHHWHSQNLCLLVCLLAIGLWQLQRYKGSFFFFLATFPPIHIALSHCLLILVYVLGCHWSRCKIKSWSFSAETAAVGFPLNFVKVISKEEFSHGGRRGFNHGTLMGKRKKEHIYRWEGTECYLEWGVIYYMASSTAVLPSNQHK